MGTALVAVACSSSGGSTTNSSAGNPSSGNPPSSAAGAPSTSAAGSACVTKAQSTLQPWLKQPTSLPSGLEPLSQAPKPGGTIIKMTLNGLPSDQSVYSAIQQAAKAIGWTAKQISWDGTVEDLNSKIIQAVSEHPSIITISSQPTASLQQAFAAAKQAGVVINMEAADVPPTGYPGYSSTELTNASFDTMSQVIASWIENDSQCSAHVAIVTLQGIAAQLYSAKKIKDDLAADCPDCKSTTYEVSPSDIGSPKITNQITSALQADPSIKYVALSLGNLSDGLAASLNQAGLTGVKIVGQVPDPASIAALHDGSNSMWMNLSLPLDGYMETYAGLLAMDKQAAVTVNDFPLSMLTTDNVPSGSGDAPTFPTNYPDLFKQLWKVG